MLMQCFFGKAKACHSKLAAAQAVTSFLPAGSYNETELEAMDRKCRAVFLCGVCSIACWPLSAGSSGQHWQQKPSA